MGGGQDTWVTGAAGSVGTRGSWKPLVFVATAKPIVCVIKRT